MSLPLGRVYGDALRHYKLPAPDDAAMKNAFKRAYVATNAAIPNFGADAGMPERLWWKEMIGGTLKEAGCTAALEDATFPLVYQRIYSAFGSSGACGQRSHSPCTCRPAPVPVCTCALSSHGGRVFFASPCVCVCVCCAGVWAACPEGIAAMRHAKEAGLVVGALSNVYPRYVDQNLPLLGLHTDLDFAATSHEFGVKKPEPALFEAALTRASHAARLLAADPTLPDIQPGELLHVGDDLNNDYLAAKAFGARALLFDPEGEAGDDAQLDKDDVVRSLREVSGRVDGLLALGSATA